jgi:hypothetical protein
MMPSAFWRYVAADASEDDARAVTEGHHVLPSPTMMRR